MTLSHLYGCPSGIDLSCARIPAAISAARPDRAAHSESQARTNSGKKFEISKIDLNLFAGNVRKLRYSSFTFPPPWEVVHLEPPLVLHPGVFCPLAPGDLFLNESCNSFPHRNCLTTFIIFSLHLFFVNRVPLRPEPVVQRLGVRLGVVHVVPGNQNFESCKFLILFRGKQTLFSLWPEVEYRL